MTEKKGIRSSIHSEKSERSELHSTIRQDEQASPKVDKDKPEARPQNITSHVQSQPQSQPRPKPSPKPQAQPQTQTLSSSNNDDLRQRFEGLQSQWHWIGGRVTLGDVQGELEQLSSEVDTLQTQMASLRTRGYRYGRNLEAEIQKIQARWRTQRDSSLRLLEQQRQMLQIPARELEQALAQGGLTASRLGVMEDNLSSLSSRVDNAESQVRKTFEETAQAAENLTGRLNHMAEMMNAIESASFPLLPQESPIAFCQAQWLEKGPEEGPRGLLFVTNARIIFEQREEIATKKLLFITTETQLVQKLCWHGPIGSIQAMKPEDKDAFLSHKELLHLQLDSHDAPQRVTLKLENTDNETWVRFLDQARSGQIEADRLTPAGAAPSGASAATPAQQPAAAPAPTDVIPENIPTQCPNCGGKLPTLYRGMLQLTCEYCGTVVPVK